MLGAVLPRLERQEDMEAPATAPVATSEPLAAATNLSSIKRFFPDASYGAQSRSVAEVAAFRSEVERGEAAAGRVKGSVRLVARLNACIAEDGRRARDIVRLTVARYLGRGSLRLATAAAQGLTLPHEATARLANAPYADGVTPYLPLLPLVTDRHVDALTLAGTKEEVAAHVIELRRPGSARSSPGR
jgi:5,10-methylenetetrahydromethanopterin reductase